MSLTEDQATPETGIEGATPADTPAADEGVKTSLTDAVLAALDEPEGSPTSTDEPGTDAAKAKPDTPGDAETAEDSDEEDDKSALSEEEMAQLSAKTRTRIEDLLTQRRSLNTELRTIREENERLKPEVEQYRNIQNFMRTNAISPQDAGQALSLAGLINTNPIEAFKRIQPIYAQLARVAGAALPADLAEDVRLGKITQARAYELSQARAAGTVTQQQAERRARQDRERQEAEEQQRESERHAEHSQKMARLGDQLAAERAQADPDWKLKEPLVVDALEIDLVRNGMPKDDKDLRARFNAAVKQVEGKISGFQPKPRPLNGHQQSSSSPGTPNQPAPKTVQEAVLRALE